MSPTAGWLDDAINARRGFVLGELQVRFDGHIATLSTKGTPADQQPTPEPAALRDWARADAGGRYRPISGLPGLRPGLYVQVDVEGLVDALDAIYPLATTHIRASARGELRVTALREVLARQSGRYAPAAAIGETTLNAARDALCGSCARTPAWDQRPLKKTIPCPEACSALVALARDLAVLPDARQQAPIDPLVPDAEFETPGNRYRERALQQLAHLRE